MAWITIVSGNLYRVAADHLRDATRWEDVARLNGLDDPFVRGLTTLRLPEPESALDTRNDG
jgi:hypothetical protein